MSKLCRVLIFIFSSIMLLLTLAFIFIEGRLVFSMDYLVYDSPFNGFIRYFFRLLLAILVLCKCVLEFTKSGRSGKLKEYLFYGDISLVLMSIIILIFSTNYVGLVCILLSILVFAPKFYLQIK